MGWIVEFLSAAVLTGFIFGVAINVVSGELFKLTGTEKAGSNTWQKLWEWGASLTDANSTTVVLGAAALVLLFGLERLAPRVPAELVAVVVGIAATIIWDLGGRGVELIAEVPRGLPTPSIPDIGLVMDNWETVIGAAVGLVLIGFSVTTAGVRQYATKHSYRIDVNQEMLAQGMSNVSSSDVQGMFNNGSLSKSPVNDGAGARSQVSNLAQAGFVLLTLLVLAPIFSKLPEAVLGGDHHRGGDAGDDERRRDEATRAGQALRVRRSPGSPAGRDDLRHPAGRVHRRGYLHRVAGGRLGAALHPRAGSQAGDRRLLRPGASRRLRDDPGAEDLRFDGGIFFVNADALSDRLRQIRVETPTGLDGVVLSMEGVNFIDTEGADVLIAIARPASTTTSTSTSRGSSPRSSMCSSATASSTSSPATTCMTTSRRPSRCTRPATLVAPASDTDEDRRQRRGR